MSDSLSQDDLDGKLTIASRLRDLPLHKVHVKPATLGREIRRLFDDEPQLPGILVTDDTSFVRVISRESFFNLLSRPHGADVYLGRPVSVLFDAIDAGSLVVNDDESIKHAAQQALRRPPANLYEPVIVRCSDGTLGLLASNELLLAQSQLLEMANQIIQEQKEAADAANHAKSQFLAMMSHEIRTPLNGVIGLTELVLETQLDAEQYESLQMVRDSGDALMAVINDILDFSKIEAGKLELETIEFSLRDVLDAAMKLVAVRGRTKGLDLISRFAQDTPETVIGDPLRLRQIILNLLGNAIKFTERGQIAVEVAVETMTANNAVIHVVVSDTGVGIPSDRLATIFAPFEQADGSTTRKYGGTGLGLSISARLVRLMQGRLWVESELGHGSRFHFTALFGIPESCRRDNHLQAEQQEVQAVNPNDRSRKMRILVAEDNLVNQRLITALLAKRGHETHVVTNGAAAVSTCRQQRFDAIFMDIAMPVLDGFAATKAIRQWERECGLRNRIVALTANAIRGDREQCLAEGMDDYLSKPISATELDRVLNSIPGSEEAEALISSLPDAPPITATSDEMELVDWESALKHTASDPDLLAMIIAVFLDESTALVAELEDAIGAEDIDRIHRAAHSLKGSAAHVGAVQASQAAFRLEETAKSKNKEIFAALFHDLRRKLDASRAVLDGQRPHLSGSQ